MSEIEKVRKMLNENDGLITTSMCVEAGIHKQNLSILLSKGEIKRISRGVYAMPNAFEDDMFILQSKYKKGVYSMGTALFLHGLTDQTPISYSMTFDSKYNTQNARSEGVKCYLQIAKFQQLGITTAKTPYGKHVRVYDVDKTICDIVKNKKNVDIQMFTDAMKRYTDSKTKNPSNALKYAEVMKIEPEIRKYLEVLI